ncbi:MAG: hypothetical protein HY000_17560, partial [Planctomycetes bacterium]|nr:hypothetical protein [Planctomycetota bacterium]
MARVYVKELCSGETIDEVYLVSDKQLRANRNGNLYLQLDLRDKTGVINARMWNATEDLFHSFDVNDYLRVRGKAQIPSLESDPQAREPPLELLRRGRVHGDEGGGRGLGHAPPIV